MESYLLDWLALLLRWAHVVVGIAWIGASFYFIWLDNHLEAPADPRASPHVAGDLWAVHGGGFYHAEKFRGAPPRMPENLHWFKWEAYWTWITGFFLLCVVYYAGAELYLVDPAVRPMSNLQAIGLGLGTLVVGLAVYEGLCRSPLGRNDVALGVVLFALLALSAWGLCQVFGGRGAFIHYGAMLATIMAGNVAHVIIPGQRRMVEALAAGRAPDPRDGAAGKQRSVHNTYFTLPVIFTMISSHYAFTYGTKWNWLVLVLLTAGGALIRVWFVLRHKGRAPAWPLVAGLVAIAAAGALVAPAAPAPTGPTVRFEEVRRVVEARCAVCHAAKPTFPGMAEAPKGVLLDSPERIRTHAVQIRQQMVLSRAMPPGNLTAVTDAERALVERWISSGARPD